MSGLQETQLSDLPTPPSILFRYRDLIADTIQEHRALVASKGACWWGWWKRPTEDGRADVWDKLQAEISNAGRAHVALFDSGALDESQAVRVAVVTKLIRPKRQNGVWIAPEIPDDEQHLVPEYYRRSPFSRAWMRLEAIGDPIAFFQKYSFAESPPLPQIAPKDLARLKGKRILDGDELRAMDTTVWHIREYHDGDSTERFLAPTQRLLEPHSSTPVLLPGSAVLHLTDVHFAVGAHRGQHSWGYAGEHTPTMVEEVGAALVGKKVGLVVLTGDLTFLGSKDEFKLAGKSLLALLGKLGLGTEHLVVVPGNHDILWTKGESGYDHRQEVSFDLSAAAEPYREFYRILMQHSAHERLSMARRYVLPSGVVLEVGAINTSSLETGKNYLAGMGRAHPAALREVSESLGWNNPGASLSFRMLALHHHLTATEDVEDPSEYGKGFGLAIDAKKTLREAAKSGVHLVLHGHRHRAFVWRETVYGLPEEASDDWALGDIGVLGGGSAGSSESATKANYFSLIEIGSDSVSVELYRSGNRGPFKASRRWKADLSIQNGRLSMSAWRAP